MRRGAAGLILALSLAGTGAMLRVARPGDADALAAAAAAVAPRNGAGMILVTDPGCPACASALAELEAVVRPRELGLEVRILGTDGEGRALLEAVGPGLLPLRIVTDAGGRPVAALRGPRPPELVRAWLEGAAARALAMPP